MFRIIIWFDKRYKNNGKWLWIERRLNKKMDARPEINIWVAKFRIIITWGYY